jgi:hypothetical protein
MLKAREQNSETISAFTENLQVLQAELVQIKNKIGFVRIIDNTDNSFFVALKSFYDE